MSNFNCHFLIFCKVRLNSFKNNVHLKKLIIYIMSSVKIIISNYNSKFLDSITFDDSKECMCPSLYSSGDFIEKHAGKYRSKVPVISLDGYLLHYFLNELQVSLHYRQALVTKYSSLNNTCKPQCKLKVRLVPSKTEFIDYRWYDKLYELCEERRELDYTMSWLSTLGGAFSALGDHFANCAEIAGKISMHQFKLAIRAGDPLTVARCKLYLSLSLIQREHFKLAKFIILEQFHLAKNNAVPDVRLENMCKGIWEKLRYEMKIYKQGQALKKGLNKQIKFYTK